MSTPLLQPKRTRKGPTGGNGHPLEVAPAIQNTDAVPSNLPGESDSLKPAAQKEPTAGEIYRQFFAIIGEENLLAKHSELRSLVRQLIELAVKRHDVAKKYNWLIIHDPLSMTRGDTDRIYSAI